MGIGIVMVIISTSERKSLAQYSIKTFPQSVSQFRSKLPIIKEPIATVQGLYQNFLCVLFVLKFSSPIIFQTILKN